jgi:energy-coupling factor transporter transmembrane protein EcfT
MGIIIILAVFTAPFVFAGGINVNTLIIFFINVISWITVKKSIKIGVSLELLLSLIFGILFGFLVSLSFGFYIFGFCLIPIVLDAMVAFPGNISPIVRDNLSNLIYISIACIFSSYCLALYNFFMR